MKSSQKHPHAQQGENHQPQHGAVQGVHRVQWGAFQHVAKVAHVREFIVAERSLGATMHRSTSNVPKFPNLSKIVIWTCSVEGGEPPGQHHTVKMDASPPLEHADLIHHFFMWANLCTVSWSSYFRMLPRCHW